MGEEKEMWNGRGVECACPFTCAYFSDNHHDDDASNT